MTTVTDERRVMMRGIADTHDRWAPEHLDAPFEPEGQDPDYNQHYVDLEADGNAQDEYASQVAAAMGADQTAAWNEAEHPRGRAGKFTKGSAVGKAIGSGEPDSLAGFSREQLQREVRRRNRDGAGIKLKRGASADEIKEALHRDERRSVSDLKAESDARGGQPGEAQRLADLKAKNKATAMDADRQRKAELRDIDVQLADPGLSNSVRGTLMQRKAKLSAPSDADKARENGPRPGSLAERRAERDRADREREQAKTRQAAALRRLADLPASEHGDELNDLTRRINDPDITAADRMELEEQRRELRRLMGVKVTTSRRADPNKPDRRESAKYSNPNQTAALDDGDALDDVFSAALEAAMALDDDASEDEFAAAFMGAFQSRMPEHLAEYWTEGPGMARVRWFVRGAFRRCRRVLRAEGVPGRMLDGTCANLYHRATGRRPGRRGAQTAAADYGSGLAALGVFELEELVDILTEEMDMETGTQTACGCGDTMVGAPVMAAGCADGSHMMPDGTCMPDSEMGAGDVWRWEGPLAPIAAPTGDHVKRRFAPGALSSRALPLPLRWQERQESGHDGAVVVGALTGYRMSQDGTPVGGEAYFFDETIIPEAGKARYLTEHGVIAPSLDLEPSMDVAYTDNDGNTFNPATCAVDGSCPSRPEVMITRGTVAGATLVPIAAFGELGSGRMFRGPQPRPMAYSAGTQIAAVQSGGWDDMPIAEREHPWDKGAADRRVTEWATDDGEIDWARYGQAFLWHADSPATKGAFKFPVADVINGELAIIPRAVYNAAARLNQADIPGADKEAMREVLSDLYDQIGDEFDDDDIVAPWDDDREELSVQGCGCASKMVAGTQTAAAGCASCGAKYGVFGDLDPYPADAFGPVRFDQITPLHIEQRPGEKFARIVGHVADWKGCHRNFKHVCLPPPKSRTNYAEFHTAGYARTTDGMVRVGKVVMGEGHPDASVPARVARAYYDATSKEVAHVRGYEDQFGPYVNGVVAPGVTPEEATKLLASPPSGHWTDHEMIAVLAVNVGGHPVRSEATLDANGMPRNMVAAGRWWPWEDDSDTDLLTGAEAALWEAEFALLDREIG